MLTAKQKSKMRSERFQTASWVCNWLLLP